MSFRSFSQIRVLAMSLAAVTATSTLFAIAGTAGSASAATVACPASKALGNVQTASNVAASFTPSGSTTTYTFSSLTDENPAGGVPGLMKYCVYTTPQPQTITTSATGANSAAWVIARGTNNFGFVRPGGDKTNIPLDGTTGIAMGAADWGAGATAPATQTIILHINDPTVCASLYPSSTTGTCFVKPTTGPRCTTGDTNVAYNAMPFDVVNCRNPAIGFEATSTSEFGNGVTLASGTGRNLSQLKVDFQSYACQSGHWNTGDCSSAPGSTFD